MAYIEEQQESRTMKYSAKSASTSRMYHMFDYRDSQDAILALANFIPTDVTVGNAICISPEYDITPVFSDPEKTLYEATVTWKTPDISSGGGGGGGSTNTSKDPQKPEDNTNLTISFGTSTEVAQYSIISSLQSYNDGTWTTGANRSRGINIQHPEMPPEGMEKSVPNVIITAKSVIGKSVASAAWQKDRYDQLWTLNNAVWNGLERQHVMFTGMEMSQRSDDNWDLTYTFEYRRPPGDNGVEKLVYWTPSGQQARTITDRAPWNPIDLRFSQVQKTIDDGSGYDITVRNLTGILVHRLYAESDFSLLGMVGID